MCLSNQLTNEMLPSLHCPCGLSSENSHPVKKVQAEKRSVSLNVKSNLETNLCILFLGFTNMNGGKEITVIA